jgi:hypothetical protein
MKNLKAIDGWSFWWRTISCSHIVVHLSLGMSWRFKFHIRKFKSKLFKIQSATTLFSRNWFIVNLIWRLKDFMKPKFVSCVWFFWVCVLIHVCWIYRLNKLKSVLFTVRKFQHETFSPRPNHIPALRLCIDSQSDQWRYSRNMGIVF